MIAAIRSIRAEKLVFLAALLIPTVLFYVYSWHLQSQFINGSCCEMTYSQYQYTPILLPPNQSGQNEKYRLLKFTDGRDRRHGSLHRKNTNNKDAINSRTHAPISADEWKNWCQTPKNNPRLPVLYIPGHWGTYDQSRSLGAHGIQMTGRSTSRQAAHVGRDGADDSFLYDVYAIDFDGGEGSAMFGSRLEAQADFVVRVVRAMTLACDVPSVSVVAHSVGGIVARAASLKLIDVWDDGSGDGRIGDTGGGIDTIITLSSPHVGLPYMLDASVHNFFRKVNRVTEQENMDLSFSNSLPLIVSISGGLRDELVHPAWSDLEKLYPYAISVLASDITDMKNKPNHHDTSQNIYGMDHKAAVWCHSVLVAVREILDVTSKQNRQRAATDWDPLQHTKDTHQFILSSNTTERVGKYKKYWERVMEEEGLLWQSLGYLRTSCLLTTIPYNLQLLPIFITLIILLSQIFLYPPDTSMSSSAVVSIVTMGIALQCDHRPVLSLILMVMLAYWIYVLVMHIIFPLLGMIPDKIRKAISSRCNGGYLSKHSSTAIGVILLSLWMTKYTHISKHFSHLLPSLFYLASLFLLFIYWLSLILFPSENRAIRQCQHQVACLGLTLPFLFFGKVLRAYSCIAHTSVSLVHCNDWVASNGDTQGYHWSFIAILLVQFGMMQSGADGTATFRCIPLLSYWGGRKRESRKRNVVFLILQFFCFGLVLGFCNWGEVLRPGSSAVSSGRYNLEALVFVQACVQVGIGICGGIFFLEILY